MLSECYPYTTIVGVEELGYDEKRPAYKRAKKGTPAAQAWLIRTAECDKLIARIASLRKHDIPIDLGSHEATRALIDVPSPTNAAAYKQREDLLDAAICAWTAALWHQKGTDRCQLLGVEDRSPTDRPIATIIAPARSTQRAPQLSHHPRYRDIDMPERFVLECLTDTGAWVDWGLYHAKAFERDDDGTYAFGGDGSPLCLRCLRQDGCVIYVIDGAGDPYTYRLLPFPGGGYS